MGSAVRRSDPTDYRLRSVVTKPGPDSDPNYPLAEWVINPPSLRGLIEAGVEPRYWKIAGEDVAEMSPAEKETVDEAQAAKEAEELRETAKESLRKGGPEMRSTAALLGAYRLAHIQQRITATPVSQMRRQAIDRIDNNEDD